MENITDREIQRFMDKIVKGPGCWGWTSAVHKRTGYALFYLHGKTEGAHRVSFTITNGPIPEGMQIDHVCHNRGCVNPEHLRLATPKQNNENPAGLYRSNRSGASGVSLDKRRNKWRAVVSHHGKRYYVGTFDNQSEAARAVAAKRNELFTHNVLDRKGKYDPAPSHTSPPVRAA